MEESKEFELCGVTLISTTLGSDKFRDKAMVKLLFYVNRFVFLCSWLLSHQRAFLSWPPYRLYHLFMLLIFCDMERIV